MALKVYKIFVVHSYLHGQLCQDLISLLYKYPRFEFRDLSVPDIRQLEGSNERLARDIRKRIRQADVLLAFTRPAASTSGWIQWELDTARKYGKRIIAITPEGDRRLSTVVKGYATQSVAWNADAIIACIRNPKFDPGSPRLPAKEEEPPVAPVLSIDPSGPGSQTAPKHVLFSGGGTKARAGFWSRLFTFKPRTLTDAKKDPQT